jgi:Holliday junction resolvasome RuvABC endonuclease subunit
MQIPIGSIDPSLRNVGLVRGLVRLDDLAINIERIYLIETEKLTTKSVRQNSDDLRRAKWAHDGIAEWMHGAAIVFAEVPVGSQSARAMCSYGVCIGLLAAIKPALIQVQPTEVKMAAVGTKTASKQEMIEWATGLYPRLNWYRSTRKGVTTFGDKNEHMADAIAAVHAGVRTDEFKRMVAMWRSQPIPSEA